MIETLHKKGELDQNCLPIRFDRHSTSDDSSDNDEDNTEKLPFEIIKKQVLRYLRCECSCITYFYYHIEFLFLS